MLELEVGRKVSRSRRRTIRRGSPAPAVMAVAEGEWLGVRSVCGLPLCFSGGDWGISILLAGRLNEPAKKRAAHGVAHCLVGPTQDRGPVEVVGQPATGVEAEDHVNVNACHAWLANSNRLTAPPYDFGMFVWCYNMFRLCNLINFEL